VEEAVILSAVRTPVGTFNGAFADVAATELGQIVVAEALLRAGVPAEKIDEVILGNVLSAGLGMNPARQASIYAGLPDSVPATTVNKVCGSGLKSVALAAQAIRAGDAEVLVAGGLESMSRAPYLLQKARTGYKMGNAELIDEMILDGLWGAFDNCHMGVTAENVAKEFEVSRHDQDEFSVRSQHLAGKAIAAGEFKREIVPVTVQGRKGDVVVDTDEHPRPDTTIEKLESLRPAFAKDGGVTAGNACSLNDGAAAVVVLSAEKAASLGIKPLARIVASSVSGVDPTIMGVGPIEAVRKVLARAEMTVADIDVFELNEAFASQVLAVSRELGWNMDRLNPHGGAIALGHPFGMTGARIMTALVNDLQSLDKTYGLETMCVGGGQGMAMIIERLN